MTGSGRGTLFDATAGAASPSAATGAGPTRAPGRAEGADSTSGPVSAVSSASSASSVSSTSVSSTSARAATGRIPTHRGESLAPIDPDSILRGLDPEQLAVAREPLGPMCVLAGAGTGKTRAITHRIAYGVAAGLLVPQRVLAVTFTARAAGEMRTRLRTLGARGVQARTFHAAALRQLHYFWPQAIGGAAPEVLAHKAPVVAEAGGRLRLRLDRAALRDAAAEVEWAKVGMLTHETYPEAARAARREPPGMDVTAMARLLEEYERVKTERGVIDFEDVLLLLVGILRERGDIADRIREQYRHFVVDEYQDVNAVQQRLLDLWVSERKDICVVGDPAQTIYSFTGASPEHLLTFAQRHPGAGVVHLVRNYRSTPQIVGLANTVIRSRRRDHAGLELQAVGQAGPAPTIRRYDDDEAEAQGVARGIADLVAKGTSLAEIAVLYRTNSQSEAIETALADADIPYLVRGGDRFFSRTEVRRGLLLLRGAARSDDGSRALEELVGDVLAGAGWSPQRPSGRGAVREQWESLSALVGLAADLARSQPQARLPEFVAELQERAAASHAPKVEGVTLASLHAAKGLEWDAVFLIGCSEGLIPISMAETPADLEEERRLLYVGLTRARQRLALSWAAARAPGGRATRRPSRFLEATVSILGEEAAAPHDPDDPGAVRRLGAATTTPARPKTLRRCRGCGGELSDAGARKVGRCADCPPAYDEAIYERLLAWRLATAGAASVPPYVVFTDATLAVIAERAPADRAALATISGVGARKLERYGDAVLTVLRGEDPAVSQEPPDRSG